MKGFWAARTPRERALLACLAIVCAGYALVAGVWQPLLRHRAAVLADIARYDRTATALTEAAARGLPIAAPSSGTPLPQIVTDTAAAYLLTIRRLQPTGTAAEITLEDAGFDTILPWLETLERDHGLRVITLTLTRRPAPGLVAATLTLGR